MATSQMGRGLTLKSYEGLRPAFPSKPSMASSSVSLRRFSCTTLSVRAATSVASKFSTLKPLGDRVLIKLKQAEEKTQGGILLPATSQKKPEGGEVVALGDAKTVGKTQIPLSVPLGANIVYSKWAGTEIEFNGVNHLLVKEDDIVGVLDTDDIKDLKPLNDRVLIKVAVAEEKTSGGLLLTESAKEKPSIGTIIAVGPGAYDEEGKRKPMSVTAGNTVLYSKFAGNEFKSGDGSEYVTLRVSDVLAVLS